ncbi:peptidoglycan DD-metalloendopeptidase family protein [Paenibacillus agilis]|nr:peptidoglycan DD-metalloendopeptidase family protein [Paenibacillus agilis]
MKPSNNHSQHEGTTENVDVQQPHTGWKRWATALSNKMREQTLLARLQQSRKQVIMTISGAAIVGAAIWGGTSYVQANRLPYLHVYSDNQYIGTVASQSDLDGYYDKYLNDIQAKHPDAIMKLDTSKIRTEEHIAYKPEVATSETLGKMDKHLTTYAAGVQLKVNSKPVGIVKDYDTAERILDKVKGKYEVGLNEVKPVTALTSSSEKTTKAMSRLESVSLRERVSMHEIKTEPGKMLKEEEAMSLLTTGNAWPRNYTVKKGDTVASIAKANDISIESIYRNNPNVGEGFLEVGEQLNLMEPDPLLTVKTVEAYSEYIVTEPQVITKENPEMAAGEVKVIREGTEGLKRMSYRLIKDNGMMTKEEWQGQEIIKPSVPKIVVKGTKVVSGEGTGNFINPVHSPVLTSGFGQRWGRLHKGIDVVSGDHTIMASDEGRVSFAGVKNGYGNVIMVDHGNGYVTMYAHLDSIGVEAGDIVEQGQSIGVMGNTGNSTGTHLHFEILKDGEPQNPLKYL